MRGIWAIAVLLLAGATAGCGIIEGLGSFSEGPCPGGVCDAGDATADATEEGADGGGGTTDGSIPPSDGSADGKGGGNDVNVPDVGGDVGGGCNASTCPGGCCNGGVCEMFASESNTSCGAGGAACSACATGQKCDTSTGKCVCDSTTCAGGCCNGNACVPYANQSSSACGKGGAACGACGSGDTCTSGTCSCGGGGPCTGCCNAGTCEPLSGESTQSCGANGATCTQCPTGLECNKSTGQCVCDATSCPNGCCNGGVCEQYSAQSGTSCGTGGANCAPCSQPNPDCSNGACTCQETVCGSTCTALDTTNNCSACGDKCNLTNAQSASCNGATCSYTCSAGSADCNAGTAPDTDGCECKTPTCCGTSCQTTHSDGVGQNFYDCNPLYVATPTCSYSLQAATEACTAYATAQGNPSNCGQFKPCTSGTVKTWSICYTNSGGKATGYCWGYGDCSGTGTCNCNSDPGWVENAACPTMQVGTYE